MIIHLQRSTTGEGPWLLDNGADMVDFIRPTPELAQMMDTTGGYFHAERTEEGWRIGDRAPDQVW